MSILPNVIDGLQWLVEAVQGIQQNGCNLSITIASLTKHFEELERALEVRDYVLTADLFEYEITPTLEEWLKKVKLTEQ
ncbi:hypothetical protein [Desulforamulus ruminis]|nr:hypothetical protein [Desulforamulus ruminis]